MLTASASGRTLIALALTLAVAEGALNATVSSDASPDPDLEGLDDSAVTAFKTVTACGHTCPYANDGDCDDGGLGASYHLCVIGEDCGDCGLRSVLAAPPAPPAPPTSGTYHHIPLSALLLLAWCLASIIARGLQARHLRRYRELVGSQQVGTSWDGAHPSNERGPVAVAVPVFTGQVIASDAEAGGAAAAAAVSGEPARERGGRAEEPPAAAVARPVLGAAASGEGADAPIVVVVQGRRIANNSAHELL